MATVEAAAAFTASASDSLTSEDLTATPMIIVLFEVREPLAITIKNISGE